MKTRVLIIGGYGNFGRFIAQMLSKEPYLYLIIAGRNPTQAEQFSKSLPSAEGIYLDTEKNLAHVLKKIKPHIVIHTSGPFQGQTYHVAECCIHQGCHYIDLADGRDFVCNITSLNKQAREKNLLICSGASSVPCLTAAIIDHFLPQFQNLTRAEYAITTAQLNHPGLSTIQAALSYAGKPFNTLIDGKVTSIHGWLGLQWTSFWKLGCRTLSNCDIPDLELFPTRYKTLQTLRFRAGLELKILHLSLTALSQLVKCNLIRSIQPFSKILMRISLLFNLIGQDKSGFTMTLSGQDFDQKPLQITFDLVAEQGHGSYIPTIPTIILVKKLALGNISKTGAMPCLDLVSLEDYEGIMSTFNIYWQHSLNGQKHPQL
ncbi:MAG: potassium transporter [Legionellales bacterium]|nr:potassium transporter [Legionellales bacterium]